jgi:acyl-coenzyme A synthetase/AMP-(fatty) acid ligase
MSLSLFDQGPPPPCPQPFNMAAYVLSHASDLAEKPALEVLVRDSNSVWTFSELEKAVLATAGGMQAMGLPLDAKILLRLGNVVDFPILFLGAIAAGYIPIPSSAQLTGPEVKHLINDIGPSLVICGAGIKPPDNPPCPVLDANDIASLRDHPPGKYQMGDANDAAYIIYTSGTSGKPRGVIHAHRAVWARRMMWDGWYGLRQSDRMMHAGAFNWTYTLGTGLMDPWAIGATALIAGDGVNRTTLVHLLRQNHATIFAAAPGVYRQILKSGADLDLPDLRHCLSAGEKLPLAQRSAWQTATNRPIFEALGMSEVSTFISGSPDRPVGKTASGYPQMGRRIAVLDGESHAIVPHDTAGILAVSNRDPGLMLGYLNATAEAEDKFTGEWFLTGDTVSMAKDGAVTYLGRDDDMMNAGGYRVSPIEVETALNAHPDIVETAAAMVMVKPDTFVIAAFYHSGVDLAEAALNDWCKDRLARYKCPRIFNAVDKLPKGANGKLRRAELREGFKVKHDKA